MGELDLRVSETLLQAAEEMQGEERKRRGGELYHSDHEVWSILKESMETADKAANPIAKLHKEMWDAVKERNDEMIAVDLQAMKNAAMQAAMEYIRLAAQAANALQDQRY